jgi:hypothetical protein
MCRRRDQTPAPDPGAKGRALRRARKGRDMKDDDPTHLDGRRTAAGLMGAEMRRHAQEGFEENRERRRSRNAELEAQMTAGPAENWPEAASKAIYLLRLLSSCHEAQDTRISRLIERAIIDLDWLLRCEAAAEHDRPHADEVEPKSGPGDAGSGGQAGGLPSTGIAGEPS